LSCLLSLRSRSERSSSTISPGIVRSFPVPSSQRPCRQAVPEWRCTSRLWLAWHRANVSPPARTRSRPLVEFPRWDPPSVGPGHSQPSRSASGEAWWLCHASRAPGSTVILTPTARAGAGASNRGSRRIAPVKYSDGPFPEGCEPLLVMSMCSIPPSCLPKQRGMFSVWWSL